MKNFFFMTIIIFTTLFVASCKKESEAFKPIYCSPDTPYAPCESEDEICYKGNCIDKNLKCEGNTDAPCENGDECRRDEITREFKCFEGRCTRENQDGYCLKEGEECYFGYCKKPCSEENKRGGCDNKDETCHDGTCLPKDDLCKRTNFTGQCSPSSKCMNVNGSAVCVKLCHKLTDEELAEGKTYIDMPCRYNDEICIEGECLHTDNLCSDDNPTGECPDGKVCEKDADTKKFTCLYECSQNHTDGVCPADDQKCIDGECVFKCSVNHPEGYCPDEEIGEGGGCEGGECKLPCGDPEQEEGKALDGFCPGVQWCLQGSCVEPCDIEHTDGVCRSEDDYCDNGECKKKDCGPQFPNGYCSNTEDGKIRKCVNYECVEQCSSEVTNGWCDDGKYCYNGRCQLPSSIPCGEPNGEYCNNRDYECIAGQCILKPCSVGFEGRCDEEGKICYTVTGNCFNMCADYRRIICKEGQTPENDGCINIENMPDDSTFGACCENNGDCLSQGDALEVENNNRCVDDGSSWGKYCNKFGHDICNADTDCNDTYPYLPEEGSSKKYFCSRFTDKKDNLDLSFCERVKEGCQGNRDKMEGEYCNEECGDSDCLYGLHCIDGICTIECQDTSECSTMSGKQLECKIYSEKRKYPGFDRYITADICRNTCNSNKDCKLSQNECNNYYNRSNPDDENAPFFSTCGNKKEGKRNKETCDTDEECASKLCVKNRCTEPCQEHEDCGNYAYCSFERVLKRGSREINYIGVCKYLANSTSRKNECTSNSDCPEDTPVVNNINRHYKCLPYVDKNNTLRGVCGVRDIVNGVISEEGEPCHAPNQFCDTEICVDNNLEITGTVGTCKELCSETSECPQVEINGVNTKQICRRIKFRDGTPETGNNINVFGSICIPVPMSSLSDCKTSKCQLNTETCILNPVNKHENANEPWKFSVEYLCVAKNNTGRPFGESCNEDSDCESNLCSKLTNKCTVACTLDSQCSGLGNGVCNTDYPAVYDINQANWILGGVCE